MDKRVPHLAACLTIFLMVVACDFSWQTSLALTFWFVQPVVALPLLLRQAADGADIDFVTLQWIAAYAVGVVAALAQASFSFWLAALTLMLAVELAALIGVYALALNAPVPEPLARLVLTLPVVAAVVGAVALLPSLHWAK